jgi:hypothetical protein
LRLGAFLSAKALATADALKSSGMIPLGLLTRQIAVADGKYRWGHPHRTH